jgi:SulP family sulfate permease
MAIVVITLFVKLIGLSVNTIGEIPRSIGSWAGKNISVADASHLFWPAFLIALLCAIESLLSARVADGMAHQKDKDRYQPNRELFGQGLATAVSSIFGGMPATGAIARTSVNVRAGAKSRNASVFHAIILLVVALVAAPLISQIPAAAIAGVLLGTSYRILNPVSIIESLRTTRSEATVLVSTALATLFIDLIWGIAIGIVLHFLLDQVITHRTKLELRDEA